MVELAAVNRVVEGSNPPPPAIHNRIELQQFFIISQLEEGLV